MPSSFNSRGQESYNQRATLKVVAVSLWPAELFMSPLYRSTNGRTGFLRQQHQEGVRKGSAVRPSSATCTQLCEYSRGGTPADGSTLRLFVGGTPTSRLVHRGLLVPQKKLVRAPVFNKCILSEVFVSFVWCTIYRYYLRIAITTLLLC